MQLKWCVYVKNGFECGLVFSFYFGVAQCLNLIILKLPTLLNFNGHPPHWKPTQASQHIRLYS